MSDRTNESIKSPFAKTIEGIKRYRILYLILFPSLLYFIVYRIYPIALQTILSLKDYKLSGGVWGSPWVGLSNFKELMGSAQFFRIFRNTITISILRITFGFFPPILLAIFLYDLQSSTLRRISQTLVYIPHFFSWVIVYAVVFSIFSNAGLLNSLIVLMGGDRVDFLLSSR